MGVLGTPPHFCLVLFLISDRSSLGQYCARDGGVLAKSVLVFPGTASAANLKPDTRKAWEEYLVTANAQMKERLSPDRSFLLSDEDPGRAAKLRGGEILVSPAGPEIFRNESRQG